MPKVLGIDWAADFAATFRGDLNPAQIVRRAPGAYDANDPSSGPGTVDTTYTCSAVAFAFDESEVPQEQVSSSSYLVTILLGSIRDAGGDPAVFTPQPGDLVRCPRPNGAAAEDAYVSAIHSKSEAFVTCVVGGEVDGG